MKRKLSFTFAAAYNPFSYFEESTQERSCIFILSDSPEGVYLFELATLQRHRIRHLVHTLPTSKLSNMPTPLDRVTNQRVRRIVVMSDLDVRLLTEV